MLFGFNNTDGAEPSGGVIFDQQGNLYGTANQGGQFKNGLVFELTPNHSGSWTETILYSFTGGADGGFPSGGLKFDGTGGLLGTTFSGGSGYGVVYSLQKTEGTWAETVIHSFSGGDDGAYPLPQLTIDSAGDIYGSAFEGGSSNDGVVFQLVESEGIWTENVLHSFTGDQDGGEPSSILHEKAL